MPPFSGSWGSARARGEMVNRERAGWKKLRGDLTIFFLRGPKNYGESLDAQGQHEYL